MGKPDMGLAFGPAAKKGGDSDYPDEMSDDDDAEGAPDEGLLTACDELFSALGIDVPEEKRAAACAALKHFVEMVKAS